MRRKLWETLAAVAVATGLLASAAHAEHVKIVDGLAINVGVTPAAQLLTADAYERASHRAAAAGTTHHVVVGVADAKSGSPVADARVTLELVDPRGGTQSKTLLQGNAGGTPDYSELFRFGWAGDYTMRVTVQRAGAAPVQSRFRWTQTY
jgi:hypothetical protein